MSHHQDAEKSRDIKMANRSFENVVPFKYLGMTTNQNLVHEEIKSRFNLGIGSLPYCPKHFSLLSAA
jgi:hypothetical protein